MANNVVLAFIVLTCCGMYGKISCSSVQLLEKKDMYTYRNLDIMIDINMTCDDILDFYADGAFIGSNIGHAITSNYFVPVNTKVYAFHGEDTGGVGGIAASDSTGDVTDSQWKCTNVEESGWTEYGFDDSSWPPALSIKRMDEPELPPTGWPMHDNINPNAYWIWTEAFENGDSHVYCRNTRAIDDPCDPSPCENGGKCIATTSPSRPYICDCHHFNYGVNCEEVVIKQLADKNCVATCEASSSFPSGDDYICDNAIDGSLRSGRGYEWASNGEGEGAWIQINFGYYYRVIDLMFLQRCLDADKIKTFRLGFSAGPELGDSQFEMNCNSFGEAQNCIGQFWERFNITSAITDQVRITAATVCGVFNESNCGFREIKVFGHDAPMQNVASLISGATCAASSAYHPTDFGCENAIDGVDDPGAGNEWATDNIDTNKWIDIFLNDTFMVMGIGFLQRCDVDSQNKLIDIGYELNSTAERVELECFTSGMHGFDCDGQYWQHFDLQPVTTNYVRVHVVSTCGVDNNNGFREIRIFSLKDDGMVQETKI